MARDERRRQKALARKRSKDKIRKKAWLKSHSQTSTSIGYSKTAIGKTPIHECVSYKKVEKIGMTPVIVSRKLDSGQFALGFFLVDTWCLGVRQAAFAIVDASRYSELVEKTLGDTKLTHKIEPAYARKLVEGAVEYARGLGFAPPREYEKAKVIFGDVDAASCKDTIKYGRDGKPCYTQGFLSEDESERILARLAAKCGPDGFTFIMAEEVEELTAAEVSEAAKDAGEEVAAGAAPIGKKSILGSAKSAIRKWLRVKDSDQK